jgi:hypothetical protein
MYEKAGTFPPFVDRGPGSPAYNEYLKQRHEEELAQQERDRQRQWENSPMALERRMHEQFIQESLRPVRQELAELRAEVAQLRERLGSEVAA